MQEDQQSHTDKENVSVTHVKDGINHARITHLPTFEQDGFVNDKGQNAQAREAPYDYHERKAGNSGPFPFEEIGEFAQIDGYVGQIVH